MILFSGWIFISKKVPGTFLQDHGLSAHDTAYLELAQRKGFELATLDQNLIKAARKAGVKVVRV